MFLQGKDYQVGKVSKAVFVAFEASNSGPTACPNPPSFAPYFASQNHPASTLSSYPRSFPLSIRGHPSECLYRLLLHWFQVLSVTEFVKANRRFYAGSPQL